MIAMLAARAEADQFRVVEKETGALVGYAKVEVQARTALVRYTDYTGFVEIKLPPGSYGAKVTWGSRVSQVTIKIDNRPGLKTVEVR